MISLTSILKDRKCSVPHLLKRLNEYFFLKDIQSKMSFSQDKYS